MAVIYGDTDSLFVHLDGAPPASEVQARGRELAAELTRTIEGEIERELRVESHLELKFEAHYLRFLMPTTRGSVRGSKKRYAGLVGDDVVIRGLEAVRTDWTPLARRVQRELLRRVFTDQPFAEWLEAIARDLVSGALDEELVLPKKTRDVDAGDALVDLVMTVRGPEPLAERRSPIDHEHYLRKQLAPACDVVLGLLGTSFERIAGTQASLF